MEGITSLEEKYKGNLLANSLIYCYFFQLRLGGHIYFSFPPTPPIPPFYLAFFHHVFGTNDKIEVLLF